MHTRRLLTIILLVTFAMLTLQPARAEALEPTLVLLIVGGCVAIVALVAFLVIANLRDTQRGDAAAPSPLPRVAAVHVL